MIMRISLPPSILKSLFVFCLSFQLVSSMESENRLGSIPYTGDFNNTSHEEIHSNTTEHPENKENETCIQAIGFVSDLDSIQTKISNSENKPSVISIQSPIKTLKRKEAPTSSQLKNDSKKKPRYDSKQKNACDVTHIKGLDEHHALLGKMISEAKEDIFITTRSINMGNGDIYRLLENASERGVRINVIYTNYIDKNIENMYKGKFTINKSNVHAKYLIIDKKYFIVGSQNWLDFPSNRWDNNKIENYSLKISRNETYIIDLKAKVLNDIKSNLERSSIKKSPIKKFVLQPYSEFMHINTLFDHEVFLLYACGIAKEKIVIYSPFVYYNNAEYRLSRISKELKPGVKLFLFIGENIEGVKRIVNSNNKLKKITEIKMNTIFHCKTIQVDDNIICEGSFNWLSSSTSTEGYGYELNASLIVQGLAARDIINNDHVTNK